MSVARITILAAILAMLITPLCAQAPGGAPGGGRQRGQGGRGMMAGVTSGTVTAVDLTAGTIAIQSMRNQAVVVTIGADVPIYAQKTVTVAELKVGDKVFINGTPTVLIAGNINVQDPVVEDEIMAKIREANPDMPAAPPPPTTPAQAPPVMVGITGEVVSLDPLTVELTGGKKTQIMADGSTKVIKIATATLADIQAKSDLFVVGPNDNGSVKATLVYAGDSQAIFRDLFGRMGGGGPGGPGGPGGRQGGGGGGGGRNRPGGGGGGGNAPNPGG